MSEPERSPILVAHGVTKSFGGLCVVNAMSLQLDMAKFSELSARTAPENPRFSICWLARLPLDAWHHPSQWLRT
jgi:hypothetical protein